MSAALPAWWSLQRELAAADETATSTAATGQQGTKVIFSFATEVVEVPKDYDHIKALAEFLTAESLIGNFHLTCDQARALKR